jgi:hypothetical protein
VIPTGIFGAGIGFENGNRCGVYLVWYFLFIVFVTYTMLPLPLRTCMILGCTTALFHVLYTSLKYIATPQVQYHLQNPSHNKTLHVAAWMVLLSHTLEVPGSDLIPNTASPLSGIVRSLPDKCHAMA